MPSRYQQWMYDWETRLTSVDNNRVVRPHGMGRGVGAGLALPQRFCSRTSSRGRPMPRNFCATTTTASCSRATSFIPIVANGFSSGAPRSPGLQHAGSSRPKTGSESSRHPRGLPALHVAGALALSGKQSGQRPLVSGSRTSRHGAAAALEFRCDRLHRTLPRAEHDGHLRCCV